MAVPEVVTECESIEQIAVPFMLESEIDISVDDKVFIPTNFNAAAEGDLVEGEVTWLGQLRSVAGGISNRAVAQIELESNRISYSCGGQYSSSELPPCSVDCHGVILPVELLARCNNNSSGKVEFYPKGNVIALVFSINASQSTCISCTDPIVKVFKMLQYKVSQFPEAAFEKQLSALKRSKNKCKNSNSIVLYLWFKGSKEHQAKQVAELIKEVQSFSHLDGKPKIFFIHSDEGPCPDLEIIGGDVLVVWSSHKDGSTCTDASCGFVEAFSTIFQANTTTPSLVSVMEKLTAYIANKLQDQSIKISSTLKKDVYFVPQACHNITLKWTKVTLCGASQRSVMKVLVHEVDIPKDRALDTTTLVASTQAWKKADRSLLEDLGSKTEIHCVCILNSKNYLDFLDVAPSTLLHYNPVNLLTMNVSKSLEAAIRHHYGSTDSIPEECDALDTSYLQFLELAFRSLVSLEFCQSGSYDNESCKHPFFMLLGTSLQNMDDQISSANEECLRSSSILRQFLKLCKKSAAGKMILPLNSSVSGQVRKNICSRFIKAEIPARWIQFQVELQARAESKIISFRDCLTIAKDKCNMAEEGVKEALKFFHNMSVFLYFPSAVPDVVFLQPQPLFDKLAELRQAIKGDKDLASSGIFQKHFISDFEFPAPFNEYKLLNLMESINIIVYLPLEDGYFFPSALLSSDPSQLSLTEFGHHSPLVLSFKSYLGKFFSPHVFYSLIFKLLCYKEVNFSLAGDQYRNVITLTCPDIVGGIRLVNSNHNWVEIYYSGKCKAKVRTIIRKVIGQIAERCSSLLVTDIQDSFFCPCQEAIVPVRHLCDVSRDQSALTCCKDGIHTFELGPEHKIWFATTDISQEPDHYTLLNILLSNDSVAHRYEEIAVGLNISEADRHEIKACYTAQNVKLSDVLKKWRNNLKPSYTWNTIIDVLKNHMKNVRKADEVRDFISQTRQTY